MGRSIKHFIFDIDGTLIDTEKTGVNSLIDTVRELMGREMPYEEAYKFLGFPSAAAGPMLGYRDPELFAQRWQENFIRLSYLIKPFDGVLKMLQTVKDAGCGIGCVTARNRFEFSRDEHLEKLQHFFDHSVCAGETPKAKPFADPLLRYISLAESATGIKISPEECIYIGDMENDFGCAQAAGCRFALADWRQRGLQGIPAKIHLTEIRQITDLLDI